MSDKCEVMCKSVVQDSWTIKCGVYGVMLEVELHETKEPGYCPLCGHEIEWEASDEEGE